MGWSDQDFNALVPLWDHESGWCWWQKNPKSTALGIPQLLDYYYASVPNYRDDAGVQINIGLSYIRSRYGSPSEAWRVWQTQSWY